ncbi:MAG: hypothetical protein JXJ18_10450 [Rhodobacteraceae bacterium]|nr:hypothetical protein [Paracoccaceae bacterium]
MSANAARAIWIGRRLGAGFDQIRVDLLSDGRDIWSGELKVYSGAGKFHLTGHNPDAQISRAWKIRRAAFLRDPPRRG